MAMMSKKGGYSFLLVGLLGAAGFSLAQIVVSMPDALLTADEVQGMYPNRHPLRWIALNTGFWLSVAVMLAGMFFVWRQKSLKKENAQ